MGAPSASSTAIFAASQVAVCILVVLLLRHYLPLRTTPAYLLLPVFLALALPCSIILIVPIDLASNAVEDEDGVARGITLADGPMLVIFRCIYWLLFCLTWFVLPFLGEYSDSGNKDFNKRCMDSIKSNLKYQAIALASAIAGLIYYIFQNGFHLSSIKGTVIALAYAWGLFLAIYLMGHGLVALPRRVFRRASTSGRLRWLQAHAPGIHDKLTDSIDELDALEFQVLQLRQRKNGTARDFQEWIEDLADTSDLPEARTGRAAATQSHEARVPAVITERYLADLTRKLKRARHKRIRFIEEWDQVVSEATDLQAILDATGSKQLDFGKDRNEGILGRLSPLTPYTRYLVYTRLVPALHYALAGLLAICSACVVWSEIFKGLFPKVSVIGLSIVHHPNATDRGKIGFAGQAIAAAWLCYMVAAALLSIREVKVWGNRALVRRHTYAESATWYALQVAKLTVPLSYNFITFLPPDIFTATMFHKFLGQYIDFTPLGKGFSNFFPIFILLPVCAAAFGLYGRVKRVFGFGVIDDEDGENASGYGTGGWREGKALIDRERMEGSSRSSQPGAGVGSLGLSDQRSPRAAHAPYTDDSTPPSPVVRQDQGFATSSRAPIATTASPRQNTGPRAPAAADDEPSNFFEDFAHRVKNTIDTAPKPQFNFNFQKPKWLGGSDEGSGSTSPGPFDRLFGGNRDNSNLRL